MSEVKLKLAENLFPKRKPFAFRKKVVEELGRLDNEGVNE